MKTEKIRWGLLAFGAICLLAIGFRVLRPALWPHLTHETVKQSTKRTFNDNSFFW